MKPLFEKKYYDTVYQSYILQNPPAKIAFYKRLADGVLAGKTRVRLLNIGCAFGFFIAELEKSWQAFGADLSLYALGKAARTVPGGRFFLADAAALPCKQAFDCVVAFDCLEHVGNLESAARSIKSLLVPGGWFIFVVPVYDGPTGPLISLLDNDATHVHTMARIQWLQWTSRYFTLHRWLGIYRFLLPWGWYVHLPTTAARKWTSAIAVIAQNI